MAFAKTDPFGMVALNGTTEVPLPLDVRYQYRLTHTGLDASGNAATASAWLSTSSGAITCDKTVQSVKHELLTGTNETFGPGIGELYLKSTAGAAAVLTVVRLGTPTISY